MHQRVTRDQTIKDPSLSSCVPKEGPGNTLGSSTTLVIVTDSVVVIVQYRVCSVELVIVTECIQISLGLKISRRQKL